MNNNNSLLLSIIVPIYNEEKTLKVILEKLSELKKINLNFEVIVVNDGSTDNSLQILETLNQHYNKLITEERNRGKGYAVKRGISEANGKYITFQDADLEYEPHDLSKFFDMINKFDPDLVIGSRLNYSNYTRSHNILNKFANMLITFLFNIFNNTTFTDIYSCYFCFKKDLIDIDKIKAEGFDQQAEILSKVVKNGKKFYEVPISYNGRNYQEGKKIKFYHIFGVIYQILIGKFK